MESFFLQELEASVVVFDLAGFNALAARLGPLDLALALQRYYQHCADAITAQGGRVVKFVGDAVLALFLGTAGVDHAGAALAAVAAALAAKGAWSRENAARSLPVLDYSAAIFSGRVLVGEVGIPQLKTFDVLGEPVNRAFQLAMLAARRSATNLIAQETLDAAIVRPATLEVEPCELGGKKIRLHRLDA